MTLTQRDCSAGLLYLYTSTKEFNMKRVMVEVKGVVSVTINDGDDLKEAIQHATLDIVQDMTVSREVAVDDGVEPDWVVYYNKEFGTLLQMVLGSGSNLADDDGQYINGVFVPFDRDIVGSCYTAPEGVDPENHGEIDGSCDGELTLDGKALEQQEYLDQWVGYEQKIGRMGTKDCLIGYLDLNGARWGLDDWILVAKG
jgi:hypothetical protein